MRNSENKPLANYKGGETYLAGIGFNFDSKTNEFANWTDLHVSAEDIDFDEDNLTDEQIVEVQEFAEEIQREIRDMAQYARMVEATEQSLMYN